MTGVPGGSAGVVEHNQSAVHDEKPLKREAAGRCGFSGGFQRERYFERVECRQRGAKAKRAGSDGLTAATNSARLPSRHRRQSCVSKISGSDNSAALFCLAPIQCTSFLRHNPPPPPPPPPTPSLPPHCLCCAFHSHRYFIQQDFGRSLSTETGARRTVSSWQSLKLERVDWWESTVTR
ncbi:hypothetical protein L1887_56137 [Cichorium endivia]|nr:hypothetical protein L1887_56137 [Cichorium endivia]